MPSKEEGSSVALAQKFKLQVPSKNVRDVSNIRIHSPACGWWYVTLQHVHGGLGSLSKSFYLHDYNSPELQAARRWRKKGFGRGGPTHPPPSPPHVLYFLVRWCTPPHFFPAPPASQPEVLYAHQENLPQLIGPFQWSEPSIKWILMSPRFTMHYNAPTIGHNWQWLRKSATL